MSYLLKTVQSSPFALDKDWFRRSESSNGKEAHFVSIVCASKFDFVGKRNRPEVLSGSQSMTCLR